MRESYFYFCQDHLEVVIESIAEIVDGETDYKLEKDTMDALKSSLAVLRIAYELINKIDFMLSDLITESEFRESYIGKIAALQRVSGEKS